MRKRIIDKSVHRVTEFASTENFLAAKSIPAGILTLWEGGLPIDMLVSPASSDTTIFFFHGAIDQNFTLPVLSGLGISGGLDANRVFVSDPSLVLDKALMLAWYAGNSRQPTLQQVLSQIFQKIARYLGSKRVVFFGGSGGGFAALYFASQVDDSLALIFNPQTNISLYTPRAVRDFAVKSFGIQTTSPHPLTHLPPEVVVNLCDRYMIPRRTTIAYMQNRNDTDHVNSHLIPFSRALHTDTEFLLLQKAWGEGHSPPPKALLTETLNLAASSADWSRDLTGLGFKRTAGEQQ